MQLADNDDDDFDMGDDTYVEGKHLKKYVKNLKQEREKTPNANSKNIINRMQLLMLR